MKRKLTLRLEESLIQRATSYSEKNGKSVSQIIANYFALIGEETSEAVSELTPVVRSLKGALRGGQVDEDEYRRHLEEKYL
ncbi:antitoxin [candidate division KSB1 bacterium]|nr:antitoxin [candidate division KSB1 bacterium]